MADTGHVPHRRPPRPAPVRPAGALAVAALALLGACSSPDGAPGTDTPGPAGPSRTAATSPGPTGTRVPLTAGEVTLEVSVPGASNAPRVRVSPDPGTSTAALTVEGAALDEGDPGWAGPPRITLTSAGTLAVHRDGSVTVLDGDRAIGGLAAPDGARLVAVDDTRLEVRAATDGADVTDGATAPGEVTVTLGTDGVASTDWGEREGGRSLAVEPTGWARGAGAAGTDVVWSALVAADPDVDTATMRDQLECHAVGAPDKPTWNLEPWRPDVGLVATMAARCNPTP